MTLRLEVVRVVDDCLPSSLLLTSFRIWFFSLWSNCLQQHTRQLNEEHEKPKVSISAVSDHPLLVGWFTRCVQPPLEERKCQHQANHRHAHPQQSHKNASVWLPSGDHPPSLSLSLSLRTTSTPAENGWAPMSCLACTTYVLIDFNYYDLIVHSLSLSLSRLLFMLLTMMMMM